MTEQTKERTNIRTDERTNERRNERGGGRTSGGTNERTKRLNNHPSIHPWNQPTKRHVGLVPFWSVLLMTSNWTGFHLRDKTIEQLWRYIWDFFLYCCLMSQSVVTFTQMILTCCFRLLASLMFFLLLSTAWDNRRWRLLTCVVTCHTSLTCLNSCYTKYWKKKPQHLSLYQVIRRRGRQLTIMLHCSSVWGRHVTLTVCLLCLSLPRCINEYLRM